MPQADPTPCRLSQSRVWADLVDFFARQGISAWARRIVPTEACNSPGIAHAYVRILLRFISEQARDPDEPVYIIELGAGSGRFGFTLLQMFDAWHEHTGAPAPRICYVLTDVARSNLEFWRTHPPLARFFERGVLDYAHVDALAIERIDLEVSGKRLEPGTVRNPVVAIGNYLFDSLPADAFRVASGQLQEGLATHGNEEARVSFEFHPAVATPYGDPELDPILAHYEAVLGDTAFTFPIGGVACVRSLTRLSPHGLLVLATDKGYTEEHQLRGLETPTLTPHGDGFSMSVNFHALGSWVERTGGWFASSRGRTLQLQTVMLALGTDPLPRTRAAFYEAIEVVGPLDVFTLVHDALDAVNDLDQCLALLRLAHDDPAIVLRLSRKLAPLVPEANEPQQRRLRASLRRAARLFYPLSDDRDLYLETAACFAAMHRFAEARHFLESSLEQFGPRPFTYISLALCSFELGSPRDALRQLDTALSLDPTLGVAREWRLRVLAELQETQS